MAPKNQENKMNTTYTGTPTVITKEYVDSKKEYVDSNTMTNAYVVQDASATSCWTDNIRIHIDDVIKSTNGKDYNTGLPNQVSLRSGSNHYDVKSLCATHSWDIVCDGYWSIDMEDDGSWSVSVAAQTDQHGAHEPEYDDTEYVRPLTRKN